MLLTRCLTALVLIPIVLIILFYMPVQLFFLLTALLVLYAAFEWTQLIPLHTKLTRFLYVLLTTLFLIIVCFIPIQTLMVLAGIWWLVASGLVLLYPRLSDAWRYSISLKSLMGVMVLVPCWAALNAIRAQESGIYALLYLLVLIWGADSCAYFVGKLVGKHLLAPSVSPGKTWEGLIGALTAAVLITLSMLILTKTPERLWLISIGFSIAVTLFSVMGDLFESMLKRQANLKDSGTLFPGHGGILDRIDSLTAAAPIFVLCLLFLSQYAMSY